MPHDTGSIRDADVLERFGIDDGVERLRLLRALADSRERVTLHTAEDADCHVVSCVLGVDAAAGTIELEFNTDKACCDAFAGSASVTAVALLDRVTLQFELARCALVGAGERGRLKAPLPLGLVRLQRRDAFRVEPSRSAVPRLWLRERGGERAVRILDVSATGLAFEVVADAVVPRVGACLGACRLELPATAPIRCDLLVRAVEPIVDPFSDPTVGAPLRVGCAFDALEPSAARAVQVFVNLAQTRGRRARPRLG
ncbi:MAG: flagellar brake protein [Burkholderiales bacterium]|nr:flagellar brake protein [Burkholderiales bacterium]